MNQVHAWVVKESYEFNHYLNPPTGWDIEEVSKANEQFNCLFFRNGKIIGMPIGITPEDDPDRICFELTVDGIGEGNEEECWIAFSSKERAEAWIESRKPKTT